jgi:hypothetical protein
VENTHANESHCNGIVLKPNRQIEPLVTVPPLLMRSHENTASIRDRLAGTGADARIKEFAAMGEVRLALRSYGRNFEWVFRQCPIRFWEEMGYRKDPIQLRRAQEQADFDGP